MTLWQKLVVLGVAVILLLTLGAAGGTWLAVRHYRPLLDTAITELVSTRSARDNLEALTGEQGRKLGDLVRAGELREWNAALAQDKANREAQPDYGAANQLLRERTGGDPARASAAIIDQELGL